MQFNKKSRIGVWQRLTQIFPGTIGLNWYLPVIWTKTIYQGWGKGVCIPTLNCYGCPLAITSCPIGLIQHFIGLKFIPYYVMALVGGFALMVGNLFCGWMCPFGLLQDLLYRIKTKKIVMPQYLKYTKYVILVGLVGVIPYITGSPWFCKLCPQGTLQAGLPWILWNPADPFLGLPMFENMVGTLFYIKIAILISFIISFVLIKRPFCRLFCPLGAITGLFNGLSVMQIKVEDGCTNCGLCRKVCPVDIQINDDPSSAECVRCMRCLACSEVKLTWALNKETFISRKKVRGLERQT